MKFYAELKCPNQRTKEFLIRNLFRDLNPETSIYLKGDRVKMEIVFEKEPNFKLIEAIAACEVSELNFNAKENFLVDEIDVQFSEPQGAVEEVQESFGDNAVTTEAEVIETDDISQMSEVETENTEAQEVIAGDVETHDAENSEAENKIESNNSAEEEPKAECDETSNEQNVEKTKRGKRSSYNTVKSKDYKLPIIEQFASESNSFDEFVGKVSDWLDFTNNAEYFSKLIKRIKEEDEPEAFITTKNLDSITVEIGFSISMKTTLGRFVTKKLVENNYVGTLIPFLKNVIQYRNVWDYTSESSKENHSEFADVEESNDSAVEEVVNADESSEITTSENEARNIEDVAEIVQEPLKKFSCFPSIPKFEEFLSSIDYSEPVGTIVNKILDSMGADELDKGLRNKITKLCINAILAEEDTELFKTCCKKMGIIDDSVEANELRMEVSKFVNSFISFATSARYTSVTTQVFLKSLNEFYKSHC